MWILPKQLHTSAYVPDTAALISDLAEQSQICEQSLLARSKPSLARTWSQRWKRDSWTQHLSGRILRPSLGRAFETEWTSSLEVIPASHSVQQGSDSEQTIHDTSGHLLQPELFPCDQGSASLRTSKDTSALDSERSLANWKTLVTRLRGEYSLRVKSAHLTNASASSSWPTQEMNSNSVDTLPNAVAQQHGQAVPVSPNTDGNRLESWGTPAANDANKTPHCEVNSKQAGLARSVGLELQKQWATPSTMDHINVVRNPEDRSLAANKGGCKNLREEVHQWATPRLGGEEKAETRLARGKDIGLHGQVGAMTNSAKLNPRWVETLMGLPIGWTMPSCSSPLTIEPMNSDCLATESCQQQQPELF